MNGLGAKPFKINQQALRNAQAAAADHDEFAKTPLLLWLVDGHTHASVLTEQLQTILGNPSLLLHRSKPGILATGSSTRRSASSGLAKSTVLLPLCYHGQLDFHFTV